MDGSSLAFLTAGLLYLASSGSALAAGGACPSSAPVTGNHCYFISAQSGASDSNKGTSESTSRLHAPGMPNCSATSTAPSWTTTTGNTLALESMLS